MFLFCAHVFDVFSVDPGSIQELSGGGGVSTSQEGGVAIRGWVGGHKPRGGGGGGTVAPNRDIPARHPAEKSYRDTTTRHNREPHESIDEGSKWRLIG